MSISVQRAVPRRLERHPTYSTTDHWTGPHHPKRRPV